MANPEANTDGGVDQAKLTSADYYWNSYAHFGIHEEMLKDEVRTLTYKQAIFGCSHLIKDKVVLDVGCGTGILSMFAAQAGAKKVIGVEMSAIIEQAREIVKVNHLDNIVTLVQGKIEEIELPDGIEKVDVIISEWMGYMLVYESMLDSVMFARDKWLVKGGTLLPDIASVYICGVEDGQYKHEKINFWDNVYGFNFSPIKKLAYREPLVDTVDVQAVVTTSHKILDIDLNTATLESIKAFPPLHFKLKARRNDYIHALVMSFDVEFSRCHKPVAFSTGPQADYTHWKQTIFYLRDVMKVCEEEAIEGTVSFKQNPTNKRDWDIELAVKWAGKYGNLDASLDYQMR